MPTSLPRCFDVYDLRSDWKFFLSDSGRSRGCVAVLSWTKRFSYYCPRGWWNIYRCVLMIVWSADLICVWFIYDHKEKICTSLWVHIVGFLVHLAFINHVISNCYMHQQESKRFFSPERTRCQACAQQNCLCANDHPQRILVYLFNLISNNWEHKSKVLWHKHCVCERVSWAFKKTQCHLLGRLTVWC